MRGWESWPSRSVWIKAGNLRISCCPHGFRLLSNVCFCTQPREREIGARVKHGVVLYRASSRNAIVLKVNAALVLKCLPRWKPMDGFESKSDLNIMCSRLMSSVVSRFFLSRRFISLRSHASVSRRPSQRVRHFLIKDWSCLAGKSKWWQAIKPLRFRTALRSGSETVTAQAIHALHDRLIRIREHRKADYDWVALWYGSLLGVPVSCISPVPWHHNWLTSRWSVDTQEVKRAKDQVIFSTRLHNHFFGDRQWTEPRTKLHSSPSYTITFLGDSWKDVWLDCSSFREFHSAVVIVL